MNVVLTLRDVANHPISHKEVARLIRDNRLPREVVPSDLLTMPEVWEALLVDMPITAMIRNLATMTRVGLIAPLSDATRIVCERLGDVERLTKGRVHPIAILLAQRTYAAGKGTRGSTTWTPVQQVVDALDSAFYSAFAAVEPTGKRQVLALDVSGSMSMGSVGGVQGLTPAEAVAALALVTVATEPQVMIMGFADQFRALPISPRMRLPDVLAVTRGLTFGRTDCALPMLWAQQNRIDADAFVIYIDNETYANPHVHPSQALAAYRAIRGIPAKLVVQAVTSTGFSITDPTDGGMMDVVGLDSAAPQVTADFVRGV